MRPCIAAIAPFVLAACKSSGYDGTGNDLIDLTVDCRMGNGAGVAPGTHATRVTWVGNNGSFVAGCDGTKLTGYYCEQKLVVSGCNHSGCSMAPENTGNVVPAGDGWDCGGAIGGTCRDGACFYPPKPSFPDCAKAPPPCSLAPADPDTPLPPGENCCVNGYAWHCATKGKAFDCGVSQNTNGCDRDDADDHRCFGP